MLNRMKRVAAGLLTAVFLFNIAPVSGVNNVAQVEAAKLVTKGKVNSSKHPYKKEYESKEDYYFKKRSKSNTPF